MSAWTITRGPACERPREGPGLIRAQAAESGRYGSSTSIRAVWYEVCMVSRVCHPTVASNYSGVVRP